MQKGHASILFEDPPRIVGGASVVGKKRIGGAAWKSVLIRL